MAAAGADEVAQALLIDRDTARRWQRRYHEGGIQWLLQTDYHGREARLDPAQQQQLDAHLNEHTYLAQSTIELFKQILRRHRKANTIHIVCDNARYYRSKLVREFLAGINIKLIFLPPDAPNLNLIEQLWKYFRREVLCNRYHETFDEFINACERFFAKTVPKRTADLRRFLADDFRILPNPAA